MEKHIKWKIIINKEDARNKFLKNSVCIFPATSKKHSKHEDVPGTK